MIVHPKELREVKEGEAHVKALHNLDLREGEVDDVFIEETDLAAITEQATPSDPIKSVAHLLQSLYELSTK